MNEHLMEALRRLRRSSTDTNVDRRLVTNVLLSFLNTPRADSKRFEMLTLLSSILQWDDDEREKAGLQRKGGSVSPSSSVWGRASTKGRSTELEKTDETEVRSSLSPSQQRANIHMTVIFQTMGRIPPHRSRFRRRLKSNVSAVATRPRKHIITKHPTAPLTNAAISLASLPERRAAAPLLRLIQRDVEFAKSHTPVSRQGQGSGGGGVRVGSSRVWIVLLSIHCILHPCSRQGHYCCRLMDLFMGLNWSTGMTRWSFHMNYACILTAALSVNSQSSATRRFSTCELRPRKFEHQDISSL